MIRFLRALGFGSLLCLAGLPQAQAQSALLPGCGSSQMVEQSLAEHPELRENVRLLDQLTHQAEADLAAGRRPAAAPGDPFHIIPVVFHIMHNYGPENLSDAEIHDAIRVMNDDYARRSYDTGRVSTPFRAIMGTTNFEFRLAQIDPSGNCTNGITRHVTALTTSGNDQLKAMVSWNTRNYLNIWVARRVVTSTGTVGGYAYYPGTAPNAAYDGIIAAYNQVGSLTSPGCNLCARTLSHEAGHYFNLAHTWGNSNTPGVSTNCGIDDGVADTPNTQGAAGQTCNLNQNTCGFLDNVENYMDYASCGRMFTQGQSLRMRTACESSVAGRNNLWSAANLAATGVLNTGPSQCAPVVAFDVPMARTCPGQSVNVESNVTSANSDSSLHYLWRFPGGQPATSADPSPSVTYASEGNYDIELVAYNAFGRDSVHKTSAVQVSGNDRAYHEGDAESFEGSTFPQVGSNPYNSWSFDQPANGGWVASTLAGFASNTSLRILASNISSGTTAAAISASYDLTGLSDQTYLQYKYAAAPHTLTNTDAFKIYATLNCGHSYIFRIQRTGSSPTTGVYTYQTPIAGQFRPQTADWRTEHIALRGLTGQPDVRIKFELTAGGGNNFYIDSVVVIDPLAVGNQALAGTPRLQVAPVPASERLQVTLPGEGLATYTVTDALGRKQAQGQSGANFSLPLSRLAAGTYHLSVWQNGRPYQARFVIETPADR